MTQVSQIQECRDYTDVAELARSISKSFLASAILWANPDELTEILSQNDNKIVVREVVPDGADSVHLKCQADGTYKPEVVRAICRELSATTGVQIRFFITPETQIYTN